MSSDTLNRNAMEWNHFHVKCLKLLEFGLVDCALT